jgi:hypothetical protein
MLMKSDISSNQTSSSSVIGMGTSGGIFTVLSVIALELCFDVPRPCKRGKASSGRCKRPDD